MRRLHPFKWTILISTLVLFAWLAGFNSSTIAKQPEGPVNSAKQRIWPDNLYGVNFVSPKVGWISGYAGTVLKTENGGLTWNQYYIGGNQLIRRINFVDENTGWAVGHRGSIYASGDGGATWTEQHREESTYLRDVDFADTKNGWVVGHDGVILHTSDGGANWEKQQLLNYKGRDLPRLHGIEAVSASEAVLTGEFGVIAQTQDGGQTWNLIPTQSKTTFLSVTTTTDGILAVGVDGGMLRIDRVAGDDGSYAIHPIETNTKEHFFDVSSDAQGRAVAVGRSILVFVEGDTVRPVSLDEDIALQFLWFSGVDITDDGTIWSAGIRGYVLKAAMDGSAVGTVALQLGGSDTVTQVTSRWQKENVL